MATRVRTRISFGAFANFKNNLQNQIGLNTIITSIKKLISTYNNNFAYIVNSFNAFLQFKSDVNKYGIFINAEKNDNYLSFNNSDTDYEQLINILTNIKARLDFLESGDYNQSFVNAEVILYIKGYNIWNYDKLGEGDKYIGPDGKQLLPIVSVMKKLKAANPLLPFLTATESAYSYAIGSLYNDQRWFTGIKYNKYYTDKIKIMSGMTSHIELGPFSMIASTNIKAEVVGTVTLGLCFSGVKKGVFDSSYKKVEQITL